MAATQRFLVAALPLLLVLIFNHGILQVSSALFDIPALNNIPELGVCGLELGTLLSCNKAIESKPSPPPTNQEPNPTASQSSSAVPLPNQSSGTAPLSHSSAATAPARSPTASPAGNLSAVTTSEETTIDVSFEFSELQSQCCNVVVDINLGCVCNLISLPIVADLSLVNDFVHQVAELCNVGFTGC